MGARSQTSCKLWQLQSEFGNSLLIQEFNDDTLPSLNYCLGMFEVFSRTGPAIFGAAILEFGP